MSSPLLAGNNLTSASKDLVSVLTSPGPLSVNQDALGLQGTMCSNGTDGKGGCVWRTRAPCRGAAWAQARRHDPLAQT